MISLGVLNNWPGLPEEIGPVRILLFSALLPLIAVFLYWSIGMFVVAVGGFFYMFYEEIRENRGILWGLLLLIAPGIIANIIDIPAVYLLVFALYALMFFAFVKEEFGWSTVLIIIVMAFLLFQIASYDRTPTPTYLEEPPPYPY